MAKAREYTERFNAIREKGFVYKGAPLAPVVPSDAVHRRPLYPGLQPAGGGSLLPGTSMRIPILPVNSWIL